MNRLGKFFVTLAFIAVLIGGFYLLSGWISHTTGYVIKSDDPSTLSECFKQKSTILYTSPNCPECEKQERELSEVISGFNVIDCSQSPRECLVLSQLPAIEQDKDLYYGFHTLDETRKIAKC